MCTVASTTEQVPSVENDTASPDEAVADRSKSASPQVWLEMAAKAMACGALATANSRATSGAGLWFASPVWDAVTVQLPPPSMCTVASTIEQSPEAVNDTSSPEDAVADTSKSGSPYVWSSSGPNEMAWSAFATSKALATSGAGW